MGATDYNLMGAMGATLRIDASFMDGWHPSDQWSHVPRCAVFV